MHSTIYVSLRNCMHFEHRIFSGNLVSIHSDRLTSSTPSNNLQRWRSQTQPVRPIMHNLRRSSIDLISHVLAILVGIAIAAFHADTTMIRTTNPCPTHLFHDD